MVVVVAYICEDCGGDDSSATAVRKTLSKKSSMPTLVLLFPDRNNVLLTAVVFKHKHVY